MMLKMFVFNAAVKKNRGAIIVISVNSVYLSMIIIALGSIIVSVREISLVLFSSFLFC